MPSKVSTPDDAVDRALARVFEASADPMVVLDGCDRVVRSNGAARIAGLDGSRAGVSPYPGGQAWADWWSTEDRDAAVLALAAARGGAVGRVTGSQAGGSEVHLRWAATVVALPEDGSRISHLLAVTRDVTAEHELGIAHDGLKRRIDALVAATAEVVWRTDARQHRGGFSIGRTNYRDWASGWSETWTSAVHEEDRAGVASRVQQGIDTGTAYANQYRLRDRDGTWRWVEDRAMPVCTDDGVVTEWVGVVADIDDRKSAEAALFRSEERLRLALAASGIGVWDVDVATGARQWTPEVSDLFGLAPDVDLTEDLLMSLVHPDDREAIQAARDPHLHASAMPSVTYRIVRADNGETRWITSCGKVILDSDDRPVRRIGTVQDVTERKRAELARQTGEWYLRAALQAGRMVVWDRDVATGAVARSENAIDILGDCGRHVDDFVSRVDPEDRPQVVWDPSVAPRPASAMVQFRYRHPDGRDLWLETSALRIADADAGARVVGVTTDITAKKLAEADLIRAATHDPLTGLLNRMAFGERLEAAMQAAATTAGRLFLFVIDIDALKGINDSLGHDAGDAILKLTADRLQAALPAFSLVARLSGDEFAAVLSGADLPADAKALAEALVERIAEPTLIKQRKVAVGASIGISCFPEQATSVGDLLKHADLALYSAKRAGRRCAHVFRPAMRAAVEAVSALRAEFRDALAGGRIVPYYQPKLDLATGAVVGFEALTRWMHPERGLLAPHVFGPVFEEGSLAVEIGSVIFRQVLRDLAGWLSRDLPIGRVSVNATSHEFRLGDFAEVILGGLSDAGVSPRHFEVEVTEGVMVGRDAASIADVLRRLHAAGVAVSLDDFGTGYASLLHLKLFPLDAIKIDGSFIADLASDTSLAIVRAVVAMGRSLGLTIVAEGVETAVQASALSAMGCHHAQGYHFGKAMTAGRVPWFLREATQVATARSVPMRA